MWKFENHCSTRQSWGQMRAKHTDMGQSHEDPWGLWWELLLQNESLSIFKLIFGYLTFFLAKTQTRSQSGEKQQVACSCRTGWGSIKCENWVCLCSGRKFKHTHVLVFYCPPSLHPRLLFPSLPPFLLLSGGEESSAGCFSGLSPLYEKCFCGWKPS